MKKAILALTLLVLAAPLAAQTAEETNENARLRAIEDDLARLEAGMSKPAEAP